MDLSVNHLGTALGVPTAAPTFSWRLAGSTRGIEQSARQIQVTTSRPGFGDPDVWDSGKVDSRESVNIPYTGPDLDARTRYFWRVRVWDGHGVASAWSVPAQFETALPADATTAADWGADWIGAPPEQPRGLDWSDYTIAVRTSDISEALGILFYADSASARDTYMWQFSARGPAPSLRPHARIDGTWQVLGETPIPVDVLPGGFRAEHEISIALADGTATTSIDGHVIDSRAIPLRSSGTLGFRSALGESGVVHEVTVRDGDDILFHTDFSDGVNPFAIGSVESGALRVSGVVENGVFKAAHQPLPLLRRDFTIDKPIASARVYSTALGVYRMSINGGRVGDQELAPGFTDYSRLVQYQVYDVTEQLREGVNTVGAELGAGWYSGNLAWFGPKHYGSDPAFLARLEITHTDGTQQVVTTDDTWSMTRGPITDADLLMGETYDFGHEIAGWSEPGNPAGEWGPVHVFTPEVGELQPQTDPPVRKTGERSVRHVTAPSDGVTIYDLGQNMVGWVKVRLTGQAGDVVRIRHGEVLNPDGTLYTANLRTAKATETITLDSDGTVTYSPRFTFHGFRYVEITGLDSPPAADDVTGIVVGTDNDRIGSFATSDPMLNRLQSNIAWGIRGNFLSVPTDTPARDERLGYSGDLNVIANTATFNVDAYAFLSKWLRDMRLRQHPNGAFPMIAPGVDPGVGEPNATAGWGDGHINVVYRMWQKYGDTEVIDTNWDAMARHVGFWTSVAQDHIVPDGYGIGDWLHVDDPTPDTFLATSYYAYDARLMSEMAAATDRDDEAERYARLFDDIKAAYATRFIRDDGTIASGSQTAYTMSLGMGLVPDSRVDAVGMRLVDAIEARDWHLSTGFLGTPFLLPALSEIGRDDVAYRLLLEKEYPSWLYEVAMGATTMWERWDSIRPDGSFQDPGMNSFNHYAYGAVGEWMYSIIGGLEETSPGYATFQIAPRPGGGLADASIQHESPYGRIASAWRQNENTFDLEVTVPANTTATVRIPAVSAHAVTESGVRAGEAPGCRFLRMDGAVAVYEVGSGTYSFTSDVIRGHLGDAREGAERFQQQAADLVADGEVTDDVGAELIERATRIRDSVDTAWSLYAAGQVPPAADAVTVAQARVSALRGLVREWLSGGLVTTKVADQLEAGLRAIAASLSAASVRLHAVDITMRTAKAPIVPGGEVRIEATVYNGGSGALDHPRLEVDLPHGWAIKTTEFPPSIERHKSDVLAVTATVDDAQPVTEAMTLTGAVTYDRDGATTSVPVETTIDVVSPVKIVAAAAEPAVLDAPGDTVTLSVTLENRRPSANLTGAVTFDSPAGWTLADGTLPYRIAPGSRATVSTDVTSPADVAHPSARIRVDVSYGDTSMFGDSSQIAVLSMLHEWAFETAGDAEGWRALHDLDPLVVANGALATTSTGPDPYMDVRGLGFDASTGLRVEVTMTASAQSTGQVFWTTSTQPAYNDARMVRFDVQSGGPRVYTAEIPSQNGDITALRLDPLNSLGDVRIDHIRVLR